MKLAGWVYLGILFTGCGYSSTVEEGNDQLGIATFEIDDSSTVTTVIGFDAERNEVARLDLIHGRFALTNVFKDDYPDETEVVGRKLDVTLRGQKRLVWETAGFAATLNMPAHPPSEWELAAFLDDPHIKPVLDRWLIGYQPSDANVEAAYAGVTGSVVGSSRTSCGGPNCGSFTRPGGNPLTANTCGGGAYASSAYRASQTWNGLDQWHIAQCCPPGSGSQSNIWFARKTCPLTQLDSECGAATPTSACKSCSQYPTNATYHCDVWDDLSSAVQYSYCDTSTGCPATSFSDTFNRTTGLGSNWVIDLGGYNTDGANAVSTAATGSHNSARVVPAVNTNNYALTARMSVPNDSQASGVYTRSRNTYQSVTDLYSASIQAGSPAYVTLWRRNFGNWYHLQAVPATITANTFYDVKLVTTGAHPVHLEVWLDNQLQISWDDWNPERNMIGKLGLGGYSQNAKYDSYTITPIAPINPGLQPPQGSPFIDNLNRTTGLGQNWSVRWGQYTTNGSVATAASTEAKGNWAKVIGEINLGSNNAAVTSTLSVPSGGTTVGIFARAHDIFDLSSDNYAALISDVDNTVKLYRRNSGNWTQLGSYSTAIAPATNYTVKLVATGQNPVHLEVWLDGMQRITYDDSAANRHQSGDAGVLSYHVNATFDSFQIDAL